MSGKIRKKIIMQILSSSNVPISATALAKKNKVSRQVIVGDIALLRAQGIEILATPRGYILEQKNTNTYTIACCHDDESLLDELYTIVDCGCSIEDVIVDHPVYGQIVGNLHIQSRFDADNFSSKLKKNCTVPLCSITNNVHLHTIVCPTPEHYENVKEKLNSKGYLTKA